MSQAHREAAPLDPALEALLPTVQRPSRYVGGEWNEIVKDHREVDLTFALAFPDVYEIGMSHLGFRILLSLLNDRPDTAAERVFCPWPDMADALRRAGRSLTTLETQTPLARFDVVGFSLQYEMTFSNVLEMLDLSGIPLRSSERGAEHPLIVAGGPVVFNVEPLAEFVDIVFVGDAEEQVGEFLDLLAKLKRESVPRAERLRQLARIEGLYVPALYRAEPDPTHGLLIPAPIADAPFPVQRRILYDLDKFPFPDRIVVPHGEIVHDRVSVEIMRGCPVGCRFCQAGYIYRPTRERDPNQVRDTVIRSVRATGYDQFALSSLNTGEYGAIHPAMFDLMDRFEPEQVSISLSSMHASTITPELAQQVRRVRKSGFTIAPEAGSQRMRDVINKNLSEEQILTACRLAFEAGWDAIKLYFMLGLPTETDADVDALVDLAHAILDTGRRAAGKRRGVEITLSASSFIPKPETPFQWLGMERSENLVRKQDRIAARVKRGVRFKHHDTTTSFLEGVFSRGDRALGAVLEHAWRNGARFDGWHEHFRWDVWQAAFRETGIDPERYAHQDLDPQAPLPWHVIHSRVNRKWLALELKRALVAGTLSVCGPKSCHGCAPFAKECVKGIVAETTGRTLDSALPILSTPVAPGPGEPARAECAPARMPPAPPRGVAEDMPPAPRVPDAPRWRYRARYAKGGRTIWLGHLDVLRMLLRALRRARVPVVYSQGFNPKPRVAFGPALPLGVASEAEYIDFDTSRVLDADATLEALNAVLPNGVRFAALQELRLDQPGLCEASRAARYRVVTSNGVDLALAVARFRERGPIVIERENKAGKTVQLELARELLALEPLDAKQVRMTLAVAGDRASVRPEEALREIFGADAGKLRVVREELLLGVEGGLVDPLVAVSRS